MGLSTDFQIKSKAFEVSGLIIINLSGNSILNEYRVDLQEPAIFKTWQSEMKLSEIEQKILFFFLTYTEVFVLHSRWMLNCNHDVSKGCAWRKQKSKTFPTFPARKQTNKQTSRHNYVLRHFKNNNKNNLSKTKITSPGDSPLWQHADAYLLRPWD